jgi:hypothetical protein
VLQRGVVIAELRGGEITSERIEELQLVPLAAADVVIAEDESRVEPAGPEGAVA